MFLFSSFIDGTLCLKLFVSSIVKKEEIRKRPKSQKKEKLSKGHILLKQENILTVYTIVAVPGAKTKSIFGSNIFVLTNLR